MFSANVAHATVSFFHFEEIWIKILEIVFPGIGFQTFSGGAYPLTTLGFGWGKGQLRSDFQPADY